MKPNETLIKRQIETHGSRLTYTAYHEAGHAVADMVLGHGVARVSIVPDPEQWIGGASLQCDGDDMTPEGMADLVVALYAGAEAERCVRPKDGDNFKVIKGGASSDDDKAEEYLSHCRESSDELRAKAAQLVAEHWGFVELVVGELLEFHVLDYEEVDHLHDEYKGEGAYIKISPLAYYRLKHADFLAKLPGRKGV